MPHEKNIDIRPYGEGYQEFCPAELTTKLHEIEQPIPKLENKDQIEGDYIRALSVKCLWIFCFEFQSSIGPIRSSCDIQQSRI